MEVCDTTAESVLHAATYVVPVACHPIATATDANNRAELVEGNWQP